MKRKLLIGVIAIFMISFLMNKWITRNTNPTPYYQFKVNLESCSAKPDRIFEYVSSCDPWIFVSSEGTVPIFKYDLGIDRNRVLNICEFQVLSKTKIKDQ